jgi:hypothetical protein
MLAALTAQSRAETIEVHGCQNSMEHVVEAADGTWWCEGGPTGDGGIDQGGSDPFPGGDDGVEYGKGGGSKGKTKGTGGGGGGGGKAAAHQRTCNACRASKNACKRAAQATEQSCRQAGQGMAEWRCEGGGAIREPELRGGLTPWGCGTFDLYEGKCPGVEAPWDEREQWHPLGAHWEDLCMDAWRLPHPGGAVTSSSGDEFSATFKGVGAKKTSTVTSTLQLAGQKGYLAACADVSSSLVAGCIAEESKCFAENACFPEEP